MYPLISVFSCIEFDNISCRHEQQFGLCEFERIISGTTSRLQSEVSKNGEHYVASFLTSCDSFQANEIYETAT